MAIVHNEVDAVAVRLECVRARFKSLLWKIICREVIS